MTRSEYKPLFPYFGGKSSVAHHVWRALGNVPNYVEPFFGSGAVLFLRPRVSGIETVNDADGLLANFWRAVQKDPDTVAEYADNPVNECDLHARHLWLVGKKDAITDRLCGDPDFFDAKAAGFWCWGLCCWIGGGWCSGDGKWIVGDDGKITLGNAGRGVSRKLPNLSVAGRGVHRQRPHLGDAGQGVNRQRPHLGDAGQGVNRKLPNLGDAGRSAWIKKAIGKYAARLRHVRVCCGDWSRVCVHAVTTKHGLTGVFLDPPYADTANRADKLYTTDSLTVAHDVREWAIEHGRLKDFRIVLAGYDGEHNMPDDWRVVKWKSKGGYAHLGNGRGKENCHRERLWLSPHCLRDDGLFGDRLT